MPAKSEKQRRLMAAARAYKRGEYKGEPSDEIKRLAESMSDEELTDFMKKEAIEKLKELSRKEKRGKLAEKIRNTPSEGSNPTSFQVMDADESVSRIPGSSIEKTANLQALNDLLRAKPPKNPLVEPPSIDDDIADIEHDELQESIDKLNIRMKNMTPDTKTWKALNERVQRLVRKQEELGLNKLAFDKEDRRRWMEALRNKEIIQKAMAESEAKLKRALAEQDAYKGPDGSRIRRLRENVEKYRRSHNKARSNLIKINKELAGHKEKRQAARAADKGGRAREEAQAIMQNDPGYANEKAREIKQMEQDYKGAWDELVALKRQYQAPGNMEEKGKLWKEIQKREAAFNKISRNYAVKKDQLKAMGIEGDPEGPGPKAQPKPPDMGTSPAVKEANRFPSPNPEDYTAPGSPWAGQTNTTPPKKTTTDAAGTKFDWTNTGIGAGVGAAGGLALTSLLQKDPRWYNYLISGVGGAGLGAAAGLAMTKTAGSAEVAAAKKGVGMFERVSDFLIDKLGTKPVQKIAPAISLAGGGTAGYLHHKSQPEDRKNLLYPAITGLASAWTLNPNYLRRTLKNIEHARNIPGAETQTPFLKAIGTSAALTGGSKTFETGMNTMKRLEDAGRMLQVDPDSMSVNEMMKEVKGFINTTKGLDAEGNPIVDAEGNPVESLTDKAKRTLDTINTAVEGATTTQIDPKTGKPIPGLGEKLESAAEEVSTAAKTVTERLDTKSPWWKENKGKIIAAGLGAAGVIALYKWWTWKQQREAQREAAEAMGEEIGEELSKNRDLQKQAADPITSNAPKWGKWLTNTGRAALYGGLPIAGYNMYSNVNEAVDLTKDILAEGQTAVERANKAADQLVEETKPEAVKSSAGAIGKAFAEESSAQLQNKMDEALNWANENKGKLIAGGVGAVGAYALYRMWKAQRERERREAERADLARKLAMVGDYGGRPVVIKQAMQTLTDDEAATLYDMCLPRMAEFIKKTAACGKRHKKRRKVREKAAKGYKRNIQKAAAMRPLDSPYRILEDNIYRGPDATPDELYAEWQDLSRLLDEEWANAPKEGTPEWEDFQGRLQELYDRQGVVQNALDDSIPKTAKQRIDDAVAGLVKKAQEEEIDLPVYDGWNSPELQKQRQKGVIGTVKHMGPQVEDIKHSVTGSIDPRVANIDKRLTSVDEKLGKLVNVADMYGNKLKNPETVKAMMPGPVAGTLAGAGVGTLLAHVLSNREGIDYLTGGLVGGGVGALAAALARKKAGEIASTMQDKPEATV